MNYERLYWSLVNAALEREYPEADEYENHHIVPRSEGGSNKKSNKVRLTPKEHHICHLCLIKIRKMLEILFQTSVSQKVCGNEARRKGET